MGYSTEIERAMLAPVTRSEKMMAQRPRRCSSAARYQAIRMPKCSGGTGCTACWDKWRAKQKAEREKKAAERNALPKKFRRPLGGQKRFLITAAQNATPVHDAFLKTLKKAAKEMDAELVVIPIRYKNPTSIWPESRQNEEWWGVGPAREAAGEKNPLRGLLFNGRKALNEKLVLVGDVKTQPTATKPLTGFEGLTGPKSCIIGHTKVQLRTIAAPSKRFPKVMVTTGACTVPNYTDSKAGKLGQFHHCLGAALVEIQSEKVFHLRQIIGTADGSFIDLDTEYTPAGAREAPPASALVMGDMHCRFTDKKVDKATFGEGGMVDVLDPDVLVFHDIIDGFACNPYHEGDPFIAQAKFKSRTGSVRDEIEHVVNFLAERTKGRAAFIVASNHDNFLKRWMLRHDWKRDPNNAKFYLETALAMLDSVEYGDNGVTYADPFRHWMKSLAADLDVRCMEDDEPLEINGIECGLHGDKGPNGSAGTLHNLARLGAKVISGHTHTPGIDEGHVQVGTSTGKLDYAKGPSSWLNAHAVIYANGKRSLIIIVDGQWRA